VRIQFNFDVNGFIGAVTHIIRISGATQLGRTHFNHAPLLDSTTFYNLIYDNKTKTKQIDRHLL